MPITKSASALFLAGMILLVGAGCASKVNIIGEKRVEIKQHKSIPEGNFLKMMAELENDDDDKTEGFVYQIEWYDKNGIVKDTTPWKPITIHKNQSVQIVEMSSVPDVVDYKIIVSVPDK